MSQTLNLKDIEYKRKQFKETYFLEPNVIILPASYWVFSDEAIINIFGMAVMYGSNQEPIVCLR